MEKSESDIANAARKGWLSIELKPAKFNRAGPIIGWACREFLDRMPLSSKTAAQHEKT
ncbi:hypothetical protein MKFW12EY_26170 [Methylomonas koyamae]|nr:hypothetical protein MKFW12EY_26170 [Methylomonas koyamae]